MEAQLFRVTLLRRIQLPLPLTTSTCRCGLPLDSLGHHRAACARAGVLGKRGGALECVAARICREGGGRVATNVLLRDLDLLLPEAPVDGRRLEVVVDGLPLFGGAQLAVDTTFVCALKSDGRPTTRAAVEDGAKLARARMRKEATYPELVGRRTRARLVVLGVEVGGRFSVETQSFLSQLARAKAHGENSVLRRIVEQAWRWRWGSLLACTVARAVASSLLELPYSHSTDGDTPASHEVERVCGLLWCCWIVHAWRCYGFSFPHVWEKKDDFMDIDMVKSRETRTIVRLTNWRKDAGKSNSKESVTDSYESQNSEIEWLKIIETKNFVDDGMFLRMKITLSIWPRKNTLSTRVNGGFIPISKVLILYYRGKDLISSKHCLLCIDCNKKQEKNHKCLLTLTNVINGHRVLLLHCGIGNVHGGLLILLKVTTEMNQVLNERGDLLNAIFGMILRDITFINSVSLFQMDRLLLTSVYCNLRGV